MQERVKEFFNTKNKIIIITVIFSWLISHFTFLTVEAIFPDVLNCGNIKIADQWEIGLGRWLIAFFQSFRFGIISKSTIFFNCIIITCLISIVIIDLFKIKNKINIVLISALISTYPTICENLIFINQADVFLIGLLFSILAVYLLNKKSHNKWHNLLTVLCIIVSLAIYQAYIMVFLTLYILVYIMNILNDENGKTNVTYKKILKDILICFISIVIYSILTIIIIKLNNVSLPTYRNLNNTSIYNVINSVKEIPRLYDLCFQYLFNDTIINNSIWHREICNLIILIFSIINIICIIKTKKLNLTRILALGVCIFLIPIFLNIICAIFKEGYYYIMMTFQYVLIYIFSLRLIETSQINKIMDFSTIVILITNLYMIFTFVYSNSATYMIRDHIYKNYYSTCMKILTDIELIEGYNQDISILIGGNIQYHSNIEHLGNSYTSVQFETYNNYKGVEQIKLFCDKYLGMQLNLVDYETYINIVNSEEFSQMSIYPNKGSIKNINGIIVVKLEQYPPIE